MMSLKGGASKGVKKLLSSFSSSLSLSSSSSNNKYEHFFPSSSFKWMEKSLGLSVHDDDQQINDFKKYVPLVEEKPHYDFEIKPTIPIEEGKYFDVISLLSTLGNTLVRCGPSNSTSADNKTHDVVHVNSLRGKFILLCCAFVPTLVGEYSSKALRRLSLLSSELFDLKLQHDFEIVMVAKTRKNWENDEGVFDHFHSAFPGRLAVPFSDRIRREYICQSLKFDGIFFSEPRVVLVDPNFVVLQDTFLSFIVEFGAFAFPFTDDKLTSLGCSHDPEFRQSLADLLLVEPSFVLRKLNSPEIASVEQLNKKLIGLYLCREGYNLSIYDKIYQQCKDQRLDFEIVLVCLPFESTSIHPDDFQDVICRAMQKLNISWWVFPFNNSACSRLFEMSELTSSGDSMVVLGPYSEFADGFGGDIIEHVALPSLGLEVYPFTRRAVVGLFLRRLEEVSLESLLTTDYVYRDYKYDDDSIQRVAVSELKGKNVLVYIDNPRSIRKYYYDFVEKWYANIKAIDPDFEVVFISMIEQRTDSDQDDYKDICEVNKCLSEHEMKWLVRPFDPQHSVSLKKHDAFVYETCWVDRLWTGLCSGSMLAFGKDGHIYSIDALSLLEDNGFNAYPFSLKSTNLRDEIIEQLVGTYDFWKSCPSCMD